MSAAPAVPAEIVSISQAPEGYWIAELRVEGHEETVEVADAFGSWQVRADDTNTHHDPAQPRRELVAPYTMQVSRAVAKRRQQLGMPAKRPSKLKLLVSDDAAAVETPEQAAA